MDEKTMDEIMNNHHSTVTISQLSRQRQFSSDSVRFAAASREWVRNAYSYGAKNILGFCFYFDGNFYMGIAHDGKAFNNWDDIYNSMTPNKGSELGVQGSGGTLAPTLLVDIPTDAEYLLWSRCLNGEDRIGRFCFSNSTSSMKTAVSITDVSETWNSKIYKVFGSNDIHLNDVTYNVIYIAKYSTPETRKHEFIAGKNEPGMFKFRYMVALGQICSSILDQDDLVFRHTASSIINPEGNVLKHQSLAKYIENAKKTNQKESRFWNIIPPNEYTEMFSDKSFTFNVKSTVKHESSYMIEFNAVVKIEFFPGVVLHHQSLRLVNINSNSDSSKKIGQKFRKSAEETQVSDICVTATTKFVEDIDKNSLRLVEDPIFATCNSSIFTILGINNKLSSATSVIIDKNDPYSDFEQTTESKEKNVRKPFTRINIDLKVTKISNGSEGVRKLIPNDCLYYTGGLNEYFHIENKPLMDKIIRTIGDDLIDQNPELAEEMRKHNDIVFCNKEEDLCPLPDDDIGIRNNFDVLDKNNKKIFDVDPGKTLNNVKFRWKRSGKTISDVEIKEIDHHNWQIAHMGGDEYNISIPRLHRVGDNNKKIPIKESEYNHLSKPNKYVYATTNGEGKYKCTMIVNVPKGPNKGSGKYKKGVVGGEKEGFSYKRYREFKTAIPFIHYTKKQGLVLNKKNLLILSMFKERGNRGLIHKVFKRTSIGVAEYFDKIDNINENGLTKDKEQLRIDYEDDLIMYVLNEWYFKIIMENNIDFIKLRKQSEDA